MLGEAKFFQYLFYTNGAVFFKKTTCLPFLSVGKQDQLLTPTDGMEKMSDFDKLDEKTETELQAAAFRRLRDHFQNRTDVQNIDLMTLAGFCRNCLSGWVQDAAREKGMDISKEEARAYIYGMPYSEWRERYQTEATDAQKAAFDKAHKHR